MLAACGGQPESGPPVTSTGSPPAASAIAATSGPEAYFHEQLVTNGEDVQTEFGSALLTLGMNPRDLQQDTPEHAYQTAMRKVEEVTDDALKRDLMRALFGPGPAR